LAVWFCAAASALAQDRAQLPLVGLLRIDTPATLGLTSGRRRARSRSWLLREALAALGYVDGSTMRLDFRLAEGDAARFSELAAALVRDKPSVIVASGEAAARAAQAASTNDLVASGLIASLAKPGGNITGISLLVTELDAKRLEVLTELLPSGRRFGVLNDPAISQSPGLQGLAVTARARGVELLTVDVHAPQELSPVPRISPSRGAEGIDILSSRRVDKSGRSPGTLHLRAHLGAAAQSRLVLCLCGR
jgi:putative ABC transport system substrate-binding protein